MSENIIKMLQTAAKGKAPIVAIPVEGKAPVCLHRPRLAAWLKGVVVESVVVEDRQVTISGRAPGSGKTTIKVWDAKKLDYVDKVVQRAPSNAVKTRCTMFAIARNEATLTLSKWADKEREKRIKVISQGATSAAAVRAAKLAAIEEENNGVAELKHAHRTIARVRADVKEEMNRKTVQIGKKYEWDRTEEHFIARRATRRSRKAASIIVRELTPLRAEWDRLTGKPYTRHGKIQGYRHSPKRKLTAKQAKRVIELVRTITALVNKLRTLGITRKLEYTVTRHAGLHFDSPGYYNREHQLHSLISARATIRTFTPPPDNILEMPDHPAELTQAA